MIGEQKDIVVSDTLTPEDRVALQRILYRYDLGIVLAACYGVADRNGEEDVDNREGWESVSSKISAALSAVVAIPM